MDQAAAFIARIDTVDPRAKGGRYLPLSLDGHPCHALVDSGNLWRSVISDQFAKTLGLGTKHIRPLDQGTVGTAKEGASLRVLGETRQPLSLRIAQTGQTFRFTPAVVKGLSMDVNLSHPWLAVRGWDHLHSEGCLKIDGQKVRLVAHEKAQEGPLAALAYVEQGDGDRTPQGRHRTSEGAGRR